MFVVEEETIYTLSCWDLVPFSLDFLTQILLYFSKPKKKPN
jgi:hypothetical protein